MFVEGSVALVPGVWYQLAVHGDELQITGPVNALPGQQTFTRRVSETVMASMNDHLVITSVASNGDAFYLVFTRLRDRSAEELAREFGARPETPGVDTASAR